MNLGTVIVALAAGAGVVWLAIKAVNAARGMRGQAERRRWRQHHSWLQTYRIRILGPAMFRRWKSSPLLTHGYRQPAVIRSRFNPFLRFSAYRLRQRRSRSGARV